MTRPDHGSAGPRSAEDARLGRLEPGSGISHCEWKRTARYREPTPAFMSIRGWPAVRAQAERSCGGWITEGLRGPFRGAPGTGAR